MISLCVWQSIISLIVIFWSFIPSSFVIVLKCSIWFFLMSSFVAFHYRSYGAFFLCTKRLHNFWLGVTHYRNYRATFVRGFLVMWLFIEPLCLAFFVSSYDKKITVVRAFWGMILWRSFLCYNGIMEILNTTVSLFSHVIFIAMTNSLLRQLFDWSKWIKNTPDNIGRLKVFILFLSIAIGYLVSNFILEIVTLSQTLFFSFQ